jgi:hypothetical protein
MTMVSSVFNDCAGGMRAKITGIHRWLDVGNLVLLVRALIATRDASTPLSVAFHACKFAKGAYGPGAQSGGSPGAAVEAL